MVNWSSGGCYAARNASGVAGSVQLGPTSSVGGSSTSNIFGQAGKSVIPYPNPADGALWVTAPWLVEFCDVSTTMSIRGKPPGLYAHMHSAVPSYSDGDRINNVAGLSGATLIAIGVSSSSSAGVAYFDITGPWV
jgi:hypothetical protein